ncbi:MAG: hypothetical protein U9N84_10440 [Actinomycetota bacterium]|nr:hypothetical protein [Actinomycetota bacterium]
MTDESQFEEPPVAEGETRGRVARAPRDPAATLTSALVVYIFVNLAFALPLVIFPAAYFDIIGLDGTVADQLSGLRWVGAVFLAWGITGIVVMARPEGRGVFVTAGAIQLTFAALAFLYSWSLHEYKWDTWYQALSSGVLVLGAVYLWWARLSGRKVLRGSPTKEPGREKS